MICNLIHTIGKQFRKFLTTEQGSAIPIVALSTFVIFGAAGIAVDMGRVQVVNSRLQNSIDAAGLAAGSVISTSNPTVIANKYFSANFPTNYMGSTINPLTVTPSEDNAKLAVSATGSVPTTFMKIFGIDSVDISASTEITRASSGLELVLVIDVTGSMSSSDGSGSTKLQAAKDAANQLLNILYGGSDTGTNLWVGLIPFSQAVNIGTEHEDWTTPNTFDWGPTSWFGCVDARHTTDRDITDDPPSVETLVQYYWGCDSNNRWYGDNVSWWGSYTDCDQGPGWQYKTPLSTTNRGPNLYCPQPLTPLVAEKSTVSAAINTLDAKGNTHVVLGAVWAWRMLSPNWRNLWGGQMDANSLPLDYNAPLMNKAVVLMTDGDNTISNSTDSAYGYLHQGHLGTTSSWAAVDELNERTEDVCVDMKTNGIIIYTIAFGTSFSGDSVNMLTSCASKPEFYFEAPDGATLQTVFKKIGDSLANLRISQ